MELRMTSGLLVSLVALFAYAGTSAAVSLLRGDESWSDFDIASIVHRARREANGTETDPATRCVIRNLKDIEQKLEKALPPEKNVSKAAALAKPHQLFSNADTQTLEKFCTIYKASRSRLAGCGESQMKSFAAKALAVVDFVCIDRFEDFVKAFPCIQKVDKLLDAECQKNCSEYESAAEKLNNAGASIVKKYSPSEIKELFAQSCLYVECFMHCQKPMLESKCGNKVLDLEMNSIGVTFRNLDEMMSESSAAGYWPRECKPLSSMGLHPEKPSSPAANVSTHENSTAIADVQVAGASAPSNATAPSRTVPPVATATPLAKVTSPAATELNSTIVVATVKPVSPRPGNTTARARSRAVRKN